MKQACFKFRWNHGLSLTFGVYVDRWTYFKITDYLFNPEISISATLECVIFLFLQNTKHKLYQAKTSSTVMLLYYHQSSLDFSGSAHQRELFSLLCSHVLIFLKPVIQKNGELQLDQLPEPSWLHGYANVIACTGGGRDCGCSYLKSSSLDLPEFIRRPDSLNWGCGGPASFLTVHPCLLSRKPLWLWVKWSQGVSQAGNELLLFVGFWLYCGSELSDHPGEGVGMRVFEVSGIGCGR